MSFSIFTRFFYRTLLHIVFFFFSFCFLFFFYTHFAKPFSFVFGQPTCQSFCFLGTVVIGQSLIAIARASFVNQIPSNFRCLAAVSEVIRIKLFDRDTSMCWEHTGHWQENRSMKQGWEKKEIEKSVRERQLIGCIARIAAWKV